jgi:hypothetical protein
MMDWEGYGRVWWQSAWKANVTFVGGTAEHQDNPSQQPDNNLCSNMAHVFKLSTYWQNK